MVSAVCGVSTRSISQTTITLASPNYPNPYGTGMNCRWTLQPGTQDTQRVKIEFKDFDLPESAKCDGDYVEITDKTVNR